MMMDMNKGINYADDEDYIRGKYDKKFFSIFQMTIEKHKE